MKHLATAALTGLLLSAPVHAQMTPASCAASLGALTAPLGLTLTVLPEEEDGTCVLRDLSIEEGRIRYIVDELRWRLDGMAALLASGALLDRAEISARGVYIVGATGMPSFDYLLEAQARAGEGIAVDFLATQAAGEVVLDRFDVDFPGENAVSVRMRMEGVSVADPEAALIRAFEIAVTSHGLFETYALMPLGQMLLSDSELIEPQVEGYRNAALSAVEGLPEAIFPATSRAALAALLQDMPNPAGTLSVELDAPDGLPLRQVSAVTGPFGARPVTDPATLFAGARLIVSYDRTGGE